MPGAETGTIGFSVRDRAAYFPDTDALVVADLHFGRGRASNVEVPLGERDAMLERLEALIDVFDPGEVVLAGDVFHSFSDLPEGTEAALATIRALTDTAGAELTLVEGNHDTMLGTVADPVAERRLEDGRTVVLHGHDPPSASAERYVIGHDHPAITIEGQRRPCFLLGRGVYEGADVVALPAFNRLAAGTEINGMRAGDPASPLLADIGHFRPAVRDTDADETLVFPPLRRFRELL